MKYSTGQKKKLRLQGHRKRRRVPETIARSSRLKLSWTEYKTLRQYQTMGDLLDECRVYGISGGADALLDDHWSSGSRNGHHWLTKDDTGQGQGGK